MYALQKIKILTNFKQKCNVSPKVFTVYVSLPKDGSLTPISIIVIHSVYEEWTTRTLQNGTTA